jgi:hypothetical protein
MPAIFYVLVVFALGGIAGLVLAACKGELP